jgi:methyl-accepting chemotaxis protein
MSDNDAITTNTGSEADQSMTPPAEENVAEPLTENAGEQVPGEGCTEGAEPVPESESVPASEAQKAPEGEVTVAVQPENDYLKELRDIAKKQLKWQRRTAVAMLGIFAVMLIAVLILVPKVTTTLDNIDEVVSNISGSVDDINIMVAEMTEASSNINTLVGDNAVTLTEAVNNLAGIDFEGLNKAIKDLQDAVGPMASFFNRFR